MFLLHVHKCSLHVHKGSYYMYINITCTKCSYYMYKIHNIYINVPITCSDIQCIINVPISCT